MLGRALHDAVPSRSDMDDLSGSERAAGGERQHERPSPARRHATAPPAAIRRREDKRVALVPGQLPVVHATVLSSDHDMGGHLKSPHQNKKYRCAIGKTRAGSQVSTWPSARTW